MIVKRLTAAILVVGLTGAMGCSSEQPEPGPIDPDLTRANTAFAINFHRTVAVAEVGKGRNTFVSPISASIALAMLYHGSAGASKSELAALLGLTGMSDEKVANGYETLMGHLNNSDVTLEIANSMWIDNQYAFKPPYVKTVGDHYNAAARALAFGSNGASDTINAWVREKTHGKITDIAPTPIPSDALAILLNAAYFKGTWTTPFKKEMTHQAHFHMADGKDLKVETMAGEMPMGYLGTANLQVVRLPYGDEGRVAAYFLVPRKRDGLEALVENFTAEKWNYWRTRLKHRSDHTIIYIPKFTMSQELDLVETLQTLGMTRLFSPKEADLSEMIKPSTLTAPLFVQAVRQKTFVAVDEKGTEAAAATMVLEAKGSISKQIRVDRPFLFILHDDATESILFIGAIFDPSPQK